MANKQWLKHIGYMLIATSFICFSIVSCNRNKSHTAKGAVVAVAVSPEEPIGQIISKLINNAAAETSYTDSSVKFKIAVAEFYNDNRFQLAWSNGKKWGAMSDSLLQFILQSKNFGLYPNDYKWQLLKNTKKRSEDSIVASNNLYWAKADLLFSDAVFSILADLRQGRLQHDSLSWRYSLTKAHEFFVPRLKQMLDSTSMTPFFSSAEPALTRYHELKKGIPVFLSAMDTNVYTIIKFPFKAMDAPDSLRFIRSLQKRLAEAKGIPTSENLLDSVSLAAAIKKYQLAKGLTADGKYGPALVNSLNGNDIEKFKRLAITLDKYKQMPDTMPYNYIWVNLPSFQLEVIQADTTFLRSKIICGKTNTPTPLLYSAISDIIIYPTWTVPTSIIAKEMLPGLKRNSAYLAKKGLKLLNEKGGEVDPSTISWHKYSKGIPYKIQQPSGDNNALGVIKFNFNNPFDVYLHDTNQRYLFNNSSRTLSHGCVRVQDWKGLANFLVRNDSLNVAQPDSLKYNSDSITNWIAAKQKHTIYLKKKVPIFIRYFSCAGNEGKVIFYDDIYGTDKALAERYFINKKFNNK